MTQNKNLPCWLRTLWFFALCVLLACGGVPETYYYTVAPVGSIAANENNHHGQERLALVLGVEKFSAEALYDDDRMIYRTSPFEVKYDHYRRWAATPRYLVTEEIVKQLRASNLCDNVVAYPSLGRVDYILSGRVLAFEEWDRENGWHGRVAFAAQLLEPSSRKIVWSGNFESEKPAARKLPVAVVEAISLGLQECLVKLQESLRQELQK